MRQLSLFETLSSNSIVNVSSVPLRSPFRYPGGKTWLVPRIRQWLASQPLKPTESIEPFAGGGIVSLTLAFEDLAEQITMVELDDQVAAVWQTIISEDGVDLAEKIAGFEFSSESVNQILNYPAFSREDQAFQTLLKNRVNHGGILAAGAGKIKAGEKGKGLQSRWYPETLKKRILDIVKIRDRLTFIHGDGMEVLSQNAHRPDVVFFIDPPYTAAGKKAGRRLYNHSDLNHEELFRLCSGLAGDFLMTYDNVESLGELAQEFGFATRKVAMKNTHHAKMSELLIGRNLDWVL